MVMDRGLLLLPSIGRAGIKPGNGPGCRVQLRFIREDRGRTLWPGRRGGGKPSPRTSSEADLVADVVEGPGHGLHSADSWKVYRFTLLAFESVLLTDCISNERPNCLGLFFKG